MKIEIENFGVWVGSLALIAALATLPVGNAYAGGAELAEKHECMGCHKVDKKGFGPSYKEIADKYKGDAGAPAKLLASVKNGSTGTWGPKKMKPQTEVPEGDIKQIIAWALTL